MRLPGVPTESEMQGVIATSVAKKIIRIAPDVSIVTTSDRLAMYEGERSPSRFDNLTELAFGSYVETAVVRVPDIGEVELERDLNGKYNPATLFGIGYIFDLLGRRRGDLQMRGDSYILRVIEPTSELRQAQFSQHEFLSAEEWTDPRNPIPEIEPLEAIHILDKTLDHLRQSR